jgi:hypothetical protein
MFMFSLLLFIFVTYPEEKMKENDFLFFEKFENTWDIHVEIL